MREQAGPGDFGLPHDEWRPEQFETIQHLRKLEPRDVQIVRAPTGSGKTAYASALAVDGRVMALSQTKMLQQDNYGDGYGFEYLFGRPNYRCAMDSSHSASLCQYAKRPNSCPRYSDCRYYGQRRRAQKARRVALNYAYFLSARWPRQVQDGYLFLDECHELSDLVVERSSTTVTATTRRKWGLPSFPTITTKGGSMLFDADDPTEKALKWLTQAASIMDRHVDQLSRAVRGGLTSPKKLEKAESLMWKVRGTLEALRHESDGWFIRSGRYALERSKGRKAPGFLCKPLTARFHFPRLFLSSDRPVVLMSATIGDFKTFSDELGLDGVKTLRVPPHWSPDQRPVYYIEDAPRLGYRAKAPAYEKQADQIADLLRSVPPTWSGVIHCYSKKQTRDLAQKLARRGFGERLWVPPRAPTDKQLEAWHVARNQGRGRLAVAWGWWIGMDLLDEKIAITAKVPFGYCGNSYTRTRMRYDRNFYYLQTAWRLQQGCGRTRRGRPQDYDSEDRRRGLVAIADGNWTRVRNYLDADFRDALRAWS